MADLSYLRANLRGFFFHDELTGLRECFETALSAMQDRRSRASESMEAYERYLEEGGEWEGERDEDGAILWSREDALGIVEFNAYLAIDTLREAFITSLFHFWERSAREWTGLHEPRDNFAVLCVAVSKFDTVSDGLAALNALNNLLKHDNPKRALELVGMRPDLFRVTPHSDCKSRKTTWMLRITTDHVRGFFEIVKASGPQYQASLPQDLL